MAADCLSAFMILRRAAVRFAQHSLQRFPRGTSREILGDDDFMDLLVASSHTRVRPALEFCGADFSWSDKDDGGDWTLTPFLVGHSINSDFTYCWMLHYYLLDVLGKHVDSAGNDHVLLAIDEVEEAVLVGEPDVSRVQPSVNDRFRCQIRPLVVTRHQHWTTADDLADLARRELTSIIGNDAHLAERNRATNRVDLRSKITAVENGDEPLGQPIKLIKGIWEYLEQPFLVLSMPGRSYRTEHPERFELVGGKIRCIHDGHDLRRNHHDVRDLLAHDSLDEVGRIEFLLEYVGAAQVPRRHQCHEGAVEHERARVHHHTFRSDAEAPREHRAVRAANVVRVYNALR